MKPKYIFTAVIAVSILLAALLPQLGYATAAPAAAAEQQAARPLPVVTVVQPEPTTAPVEEQAQAEAATLEPTAEPTPEQPAAQPDGTAALPAQDAAPAGESTALLAQDSAPGNEAGALPAEEAAPADEDLRNFVASVRNEQQGTVAGIYVPGLFGMPVTGQPGGDESFISSDDNVLTQYAKPAEYGVTALLAHNYLNSGKTLSKLKPEQDVYVVYGDGKVSRYRVTSVQYYQALSPHDIRSDFRDLNGPGGEILGFGQLFDRIYTTPDRLVFQTCLEANGELSWGRVFISADPTG